MNPHYTHAGAMTHMKNVALEQQLSLNNTADLSKVFEATFVRTAEVSVFLFVILFCFA